MGGGDLNLKKSWHPSTFANLKKVWEAEQAFTKEQQKLEQLRKEKDSEREVEEMRKLQENVGLITKLPERVEWMYSGQGSAASNLSEEYLLGKRRIDAGAVQAEYSQRHQEVSLRSKSFSKSPALNPQNVESTMREDPLFSIKKKEQELVENISRFSSVTRSRVDGIRPNEVRSSRSKLTEQKQNVTQMHSPYGEKKMRSNSHRYYSDSKQERREDIGHKYRGRGSSRSKSPRPR